MPAALKHNYFEKCSGCPEGGHSSFWRTVVMSPQWQTWVKKQERESTYDVHMCHEVGWISQKHFQDFLTFCKTYDSTNDL